MGSLTNLINAFNSLGGVSSSNNYDVAFYWNKNQSASLLQQFANQGALNVSSINITGAQGFMFESMCDEAQLPNIQAMTGTVTGRYLGEGQVNYPHTKMYSDFQLSWISDSNMSALKILNLWYSFIFQEFGDDTRKIFLEKTKIPVGLGEVKGKAISGDKITRNKKTRLNFPDSYLADIVITKTERGQGAPNSRASIAYTMKDCFPYSIDAVPLSYGASQTTKVTANFYYSRYSYTYNPLNQTYEHK